MEKMLDLSMSGPGLCQSFERAGRLDTWKDPGKHCALSQAGQDSCSLSGCPLEPAVYAQCYARHCAQRGTRCSRNSEGCGPRWRLPSALTEVSQAVGGWQGFSLHVGGGRQVPSGRGCDSARGWRGQRPPCTGREGAGWGAPVPQDPAGRGVGSAWTPSQVCVEGLGQRGRGWGRGRCLKAAGCGAFLFVCLVFGVDGW